MSYAVTSQKLAFYGSQNALLDARLDMPQGVEARCFVILSHCFTCTKETLTTARVARGLAQHGYAVLRFDFTGLGGSEGEFAESNFSSMVKDILCAQAYLTQHYSPARALLGHSMGGTASLVASRESDAVKTVVTLASPSQPAHVLHHFGSVLQVLETGQDACITVAGVKYPVKPQFISDVRQYNMHELMAAYSKPVFALRASKDALVRAQDADEIIQYTQGDKAIRDMELADHLFSDRNITNTMIGEIVSWLDAYTA